MVEDQDGGIAIERAGECDALALATAQLNASFSYNRFILFRKILNEHMCIGTGGGGYYFFIGGGWFSVGYIFFDAAAK